jgi:hypothetical protein
MLSLKFLCNQQKILKTRPSKSERTFTGSYLRNNAVANRHLSGLETLFLTADPAHAQISSTLI